MSRAYDNAADGRYQQGGRRNLIINGAMEVAQRGTTSGSTTSNGYLSLDRFGFNASGGTYTFSQETLAPGQTDLPTQFKNHARIAVSSGNNNMGLYHRIEDVRSVGDAQKITFSFYAKGQNPGGGELYLFMYQNFGSGGSSTVTFLNEQSVVITSGWTRHTFTIDVPSISGKTIGTGSNIEITLVQPNSDTSTDAYTYDITGVQLETGTIATPFEHRSYGEELALCQRYYQKYSANGAYTRFSHCFATSTTALRCYMTFITPMRSAPTMSNSGSFGSYSSAGVNSASSLTYTYQNVFGTAIDATTSGVTTNASVTLLANNDSSAFISADAEL